jgi:hypothetical protein
MDFILKKISELNPALSVADEDLILIVDTSDKSASSVGTTKNSTFQLLKEAILDEVPEPPSPPPAYVLPKATNSILGGVVVGDGLSVDAGGVLRSTFSGVYDDLINKPVIPSVLGDLTNVFITQPSQGQALKFFNGAWVNQKISFGELENIPDTLVLRDTSTSLNNLVISENLQVNGTTISNNFATLNVGTSSIILNDNVGKFAGNATPGSDVITLSNSTFGITVGANVSIFSSQEELTLAPDTVVLQIQSGNQILLSNNIQGLASEEGVIFLIEVQPTSNASLEVNRSALSNVSVRWNEQLDRWQFTNNGNIFYPIPLPSEYSDYEALINKPAIPQSIRDLIDVGDSAPEINSFLRWSGNEYLPSSVTAGDLSQISINALSDVNTTNPATLGQVLKWNGNAWAPGNDLIGDLTTEGGAIVTTPGSSSIIPFYHATFDAFPSPTTYKGALAYTESGGKLYYAHSNQWLELALASNVQPNTDTTYTLTSQDVSGASGDKFLTLTPSTGVAQNVRLRGQGGVSLSRDTDGTLRIIGRTYELKAQNADSPADSKLRLLDSSSGTSEITFQGANGLLVERKDDNTLVFRAPPTTVTQYTDKMAREAVAAALITGTHVGITFTYDGFNEKINSVVTAGGSGEGEGTVVLYSLGVSNTTTNQAIVSLTPSIGTADTFQIVGVGGTQVSWNSTEKKVSIVSVAPVNADWNATSGLAQILNKPVIPPAYTLPIASSGVLGGVKIGENLAISQDGTLSAISGGYELPIASASVLGGIKIGSGLSISSDGTVTVAAGEGGTPLQVRNVISGTTGIIGDNMPEELVLQGHKTYSLLKMASSTDAWIRVYVDLASMIADRNRSEGNDPGPGSGVIAEIRGEGTKLMTPAPIGYNNDTPVSSNVYVSVVNRSGTSQAITVSLTLLRLEA